MAETSAERASAVAQVAAATADEDTTVQKAAMDVLRPPTQPTIDKLWLILVGGLVGALLASVIGLIVWVGHTNAQTDKIITVFSAVLAGLVGLFVTSPLESGGSANN